MKRSSIADCSSITLAFLLVLLGECRNQHQYHNLILTVLESIIHLVWQINLQRVGIRMSYAHPFSNALIPVFLSIRIFSLLPHQKPVTFGSLKLVAFVRPSNFETRKFLTCRSKPINTLKTKIDTTYMHSCIVNMYIEKTTQA